MGRRECPNVCPARTRSRPTAAPSLRCRWWWQTLERVLPTAEYRIHQLYLTSCSNTWRQWRWTFTEQKQIVDTELLGSHYRWLERLYDEAKATVMARYTYDEHDCLTLTGIHPRGGRHSLHSKTHPAGDDEAAGVRSMGPLLP